jgi:hypothetical protein
MKPEQTIFRLDLDQIRKALRDSLHERIPVDDYIDEMYSARPITDFEIDGQHEIRSIYSSTGNPIVCEIDNTVDAPEQGDYILTPSGPLLGLTSLSTHEGQHIGEYQTTDVALEIVASRMEAEQFYPNIWWISDHGNLWQIDIHGCEI